MLTITVLLLWKITTLVLPMPPMGRVASQRGSHARHEHEDEGDNEVARASPAEGPGKKRTEDSSMEENGTEKAFAGAVVKEGMLQKKVVSSIVSWVRWKASMTKDILYFTNMPAPGGLGAQSDSRLTLHYRTHTHVATCATDRLALLHLAPSLPQNRHRLQDCPRLHPAARDTVRKRYIQR
jgi:hypothetical protein